MVMRRGIKQWTSNTAGCCSCVYSGISIKLVINTNNNNAAVHRVYFINSDFSILNVHWLCGKAHKTTLRNVYCTTFTTYIFDFSSNDMQHAFSSWNVYLLEVCSLVGNCTYFFFLLFIFCSCFILYMCFGCATQVPVLVRGVQLQCIEFWLFDGYNSMKSDENVP